LTSASTDAGLIVTPNRSSSKRAVSRRDMRAAVNVTAAAITSGAKPPGETPAGSSVSVPAPH
jgi:hypothetical protein